MVSRGKFEIVWWLGLNECYHLSCMSGTFVYRRRVQSSQNDRVYGWFGSVLDFLTVESHHAIDLIGFFFLSECCATLCDGTIAKLRLYLKLTECLIEFLKTFFLRDLTAACLGDPPFYYLGNRQCRCSILRYSLVTICDAASFFNFGSEVSFFDSRGRVESEFYLILFRFYPILPDGSGQFHESVAVISATAVKPANLAIIVTVAMTLPRDVFGTADASATYKPSTPLTLKVSSRTAPTPAVPA